MAGQVVLVAELKDGGMAAIHQVYPQAKQNAVEITDDHRDARNQVDALGQVRLAKGTEVHEREGSRGPAVP